MVKIFRSWGAKKKLLYMEILQKQQLEKIGSLFMQKNKHYYF